MDWLANQKKRHNLQGILGIKLFGFEKVRGNANCLYKGYFLFEKPFKDLRTEAATRHSLKVKFSDMELLVVIESVVRALKWLKSLDHVHGAVSTTNILMSQSGTITLSDPWINPELNAHYRSKNRLYLSP